MKNRVIQLLMCVSMGVLASAFLAGPFQAGTSYFKNPFQKEASIESINAAQFRSILNANRGKVVLVNLWATWCVPCLKELPDLAKLNEKYKEQGVKLITVSMDDEADLARAKKLLAERGPGLEGYLQAEGDQEKFVGVIDPTWSDIMPTTFLLDREGKMTTKLLGGKSGAEFEAALAPLLQQGAK